MGRTDKKRVGKIDAYLDYLERRGKELDTWLESLGLQGVGENNGEVILVGLAGFIGPVFLMGVVIGAVGSVVVRASRR